MTVRKDMYSCVRKTVLSLLLLLLLLLHQGEAGQTEASSHSPSLRLSSQPDTLEKESGEAWRRRGGEEKKGVEGPPGEREKSGETILDFEKTLIVHESAAGQKVLAGVMGACLGLMGGFVLSILLGCCYLKCSRRGTLMFDRSNYTYRSADLIDGGV